ncbi:hypothetical protein P3G55_03285 [Leptospira sp. 96542]|nr:hypothetical protein [Leptospira sp. 96542]
MAPRKFDSEIHITPDDKWMFRGMEIDKEEILKYFRANLHGDSKGVYIENTFGELSENGYLRIDGFPCHVLHVTKQDNSLMFETDDGNSYEFGEFEVYETKDGGLLGRRAKEEKIYYRFTWNAAKDLSMFLEETDAGVELKLGDTEMEIPKFTGETEVAIPRDI